MSRVFALLSFLSATGFPGCRAPDADAVVRDGALARALDEVRRLELERHADPAAWAPWLASRDALVRERVYRAAGRLGVRFPVELLRRAPPGDEVPAVLAARTFAWAHRGGDEAFEHVDAVAASTRDPIVRAAAFRGLAAFPQRHVELATRLVEGLAAEASVVREEAARTAGVVARSVPDAARPAFTAALSPLLRTLATRDLERRVQVEAARALGGWPELTRHAEEALPFLLRLVREFDPDLRIAAARALAAMPERNAAAIEARVATASDLEWRVVAVALRGLRGALDPEQRLTLRRELEATRANGASFHVRVALTDALADDPPTWPLLREQLGDVSRTVRVHSFLALAQFDPPAVDEVLEAWADGADPIQREAAARALAWGAVVRARTLLPAALADPHPLVRAAALEVAIARRAELGDAAEEALRAALGTGDLGDVGSVLTAFAGDPSFAAAPWRDAIEEAVARFSGFEGIELRALRAQLFGEPVPEEAPRFSAIDLSVLPASGTPRAVLHTNRGALFVELDADTAPVHVANFLNHARAGDYDGLSFHRVVSAFVVQGLDPRGDGFGSCRQRLPNEISPLRYGAGSLGMPDAGLDSGGCQVFFTHDAVPRLDERYTVFGRITAGLDVLDRIERGDRCLRVDVYPGG